MEAREQQGTDLRGLSRFLVEHAPCGQGFDVSHPAGLGSGVVSMTCRGCHANYEYATATIEFERELELETVPMREGRPTAGPIRPIQTQPHAPKKSRRRRLDRNRLAAGLALLGTFAVAAIAIWMILGGGTSSEPSNVTALPTTPTRAPAKTPTQTRSAKAPAPPPKKEPRAPTIPKTVITTSTFSVAIPKTWSQGNAAGGLALTPSSTSSVAVEIFQENDPSLSLEGMGAKTASFLRSRDPGAGVTATGGLRVDGNPAFKLRAVGPSGVQIALGVVAEPIRFLVIERVDKGAPSRLETQANQVLASFRPR